MSGPDFGQGMKVNLADFPVWLRMFVPPSIACIDGVGLCLQQGRAPGRLSFAQEAEAESGIPPPTIH
jgi:hypothetical protein